MPTDPRSLHARLSWGLWIILLLSVPVTSFPLFSQTSGGETPVGPLSLIPLGALLIVWLAPYVLGGGKIPRTVKPLLSFAVLSVISAAAAVFLPILPYKGQVPIMREMRALVTLAIGMGFFLCAAILPNTEARRHESLRAIYLGGLAALIWSSAQAWVVLSRADHVPLILTQIHHFFSVRDPLVDRVTGMAYEPSWLGNQIMVLYLPLLAASVFTRESAFPWKRGYLSLEAVMLVWGLAILALTKSRISQISFLALTSVLLIGVGWRALGSLQRRLRLLPGSGWSARGIPVAVGKALVLLALAAGLFAGAASAAARVDPRLWALPSIQARLDELRYLYPNDVVLAVSDRLAFAERVVYWTAAFRTFGSYPILGVGPGNAGFFFEQNLPEYGLRLQEIRALLREPSFGFPNPKNLWIKLLAETGIVGFLLFSVWFVAIGAGAVVLWRKGTGIDRMIGLAGSMVFLTQIIEGFSLDSFALPQMWIVFGLVTAALWRSPLLGVALEPSGEGSSSLRRMKQPVGAGSSPTT